MEEHLTQYDVAKWLRIQAENPEGMNFQQLAKRIDWAIQRREPSEVVARQILQQLANDADHSALLFRMSQGKEPLPEPPPLRNSYPDYPD